MAERKLHIVGNSCVFPPESMKDMFVILPDAEISAKNNDHLRAIKTSPAVDAPVSKKTYDMMTRTGDVLSIAEFFADVNIADKDFKPKPVN